MMRIVHLIPRFPYFNDNSIVGGSANALYNLAKQQSGKLEYRILTQVPGNRLSDAPINIVPLEINAPPTTVHFGLLYLVRIVQKAIVQRESIDVVHGHSGYVDYILATSIFAGIRKAPAIHSLYCPVSRTNKIRFFFQKAALLVSDPFIRFYVAVSQNVANSLKWAGVHPEKIVVVPPIVDVARFNPNVDRHKSREKLGLGPDEPIVLFVGSTKPVKNLDAVLRALSLVVQEIPETKLIVTTELQHKAHEQRSTYLTKLVNEKGIKKNIIEFGVVQNMPELMAASDVLVAPFLDTNGPSDYFQAALEAMAVGRPVIVSAVGGMPEIVGKDVGFLVNPEDVPDIASKLLTILRNRELSISLGQNASALAHKKFNPQAIEQKMRDLYLTVNHGQSTNK